MDESLVPAMFNINIKFNQKNVATSVFAQIAKTVQLHMLMTLQEQLNSSGNRKKYL